MNLRYHVVTCAVLRRMISDLSLPRRDTPKLTSIRRHGTCARGDINTDGTLRPTVNIVLRKWRKEFIINNVSEPQESIEYIIAHVLERKKIVDVHKRKGMVLLPRDVQLIDSFCRQRIAKMPVQYIIQEWDFRDLTLKMSRPVFIPRPETEMLVDIVLNEIDFKRADKVLELCCGSGAISLALLKSRPQLQITAIDKSEDACTLTKENADINHLSSRLQIIRSEITDNSKLNKIIGNYDVIVSNPPYVPSGDMDRLQPEISLYEDPAALDGGDDGLTVIKSILSVCSRLLNYDGKLFLEVDPTHPALIKCWLEEHDSLRLKLLRSFRDFCGKERFVEILKEK